MDALAGLDALIPSGGGGATDGWSAAHDALLNAAQTVFSIDAQALNLCPDCGAGLLEVPSQLVAGATETLTDAGNNLAGGELPGTDVPGTDPTGDPQPQQGNGGKGDGPPSGMFPPETPVELPTETTDSSTGLGGLLPGGGTDDTGNGGGGNGGNGGKGGKGGKVDLAPVTATVNEVVTGVVAGVNGLLNGLSGN
jgi:hypothetical protein